MASLAATITAAIMKVSGTNPALDRDGEPTAEEARDHFTAALLYELGLGPNPSAEHATVTEPKAPKKRAAKAIKEATPDVEAVAEQMGKLALEEPKPKKARKTKTESAPVSSESESEKPVEKKKPGPKPKKAEAPHPGMGAGVPAPVAAPAPVAVPVVPEAAPKKKPGPKPKAKPEGPVNVEKLTPTHKKHLKAIAEELKVESRDKEFLAYANAMSAEEWGASPLDTHIRAFLMPATPALAAPPTEFLEVTFNDVDYLVDPKTRYVYAASDDGMVRARDHVGVVGLLEFAEMDIDE